MKVIFTPAAQRQIDRLHAHITTQASENVADGYVGRIVEFCLRLDVFPVRGVARDDILKGLRTIGFERRVTIAFLIAGDIVLIEGIFYGGQDFETMLRSR